MRAPAPPDLQDLPLHVLVRDFPEALAVLRRFGVDVRAQGAEPLAAAGADAAALYNALRQATAWRDTAGPSPCDRDAARTRATPVPG